MWRTGTEGERKEGEFKTKKVALRGTCLSRESPRWKGSVRRKRDRASARDIKRIHYKKSVFNIIEKLI